VSCVFLVLCSILLLFLSAATSAAGPAIEEAAEKAEEASSETTIAEEESPLAREAEADRKVEKTSWLGFLAKGGLTMVPIALCSIGFIAIIAVKFSIFRMMRFGINNFAQALTEHVSSGNIDEAIEQCEEADNPIARPLMRGLTVYKTDPSRTGDAMREAMLDEMPGLESYIGWLGIIAGVAPLLGLFGTVIGIIQSFIQLAAGGAVTDPKSFTLLADGIYKALITTAAGLFVGIPALVMYEYFRMKIGDLMRDMDRVSVSLLNALGIGFGGQP
jgi:biopolymer transport protein ExbB